MKSKEQYNLPSLPCLLLLALFFLCGMILGQVASARVPPATGEELRVYLRHFVTLEERGSADALVSTLVLYLRYPLAAFLLGFASIGVVLLPCVSLLFGFFLSFSVCCFTASFGSAGIWIALAVSGLRCLWTLPCFFLLAVPSFRTSAALARLTFGKGQRAVVVYGKACWLRLLICLAALLAGMCVDYLLSPRLLALALERVVL